MDVSKEEGWLGRLARRLHLLIDPRRERRSASHPLQQSLLSLRGREHEVAVLDLSQSGAMIAFDGHAYEGDPVTIQLLDHGRVAGQLRWIREGRAGISFDRPLVGEVRSVSVR